MFEDEKVEIEETEKQVSPIKEWISLGLYFICVIIVALLINRYVGQRTYVSGSSMEPTLHDGDNLIVDKISYRFIDPKRYDIIVFPYAYKEDTYYIKRIIAMPGETIQIIDGYVYIDGELLNESYGAAVMENPGLAQEPLTLGEDEYFLLGDNRNASADSRDEHVGPIHKDDLIGRAFVRIYPFNSIKILEHQ